MKTFLTRLLLLILLVPGAVLANPEPAGGLVARVFPMKHKAADRAAAAIKTLVSAEGSVSIQPASNTLVVTDRAEKIREIAAALEKFDSAPKPFILEIKLVAAGRAATPTPVPDDLKEISSKLSGVLRFNSFEKLGELTAEGAEGDPAVIDVAAQYRADFKFGEYEAASDSLRVSEFRLSRIDASGSGELTQLLKTSLNLKVGQTVILGASRLPESQRALMLVLTARRAK